MAPNILMAIKNIAEFGDTNLQGYSTKYLIGINAAGEQLEYYLKDAFANSFSAVKSRKQLIYSNVFEWNGNQNNPPDFILKGGDAFEIKKKESAGGAIPLNSSSPKDRLHASDCKLSADCRICDGGEWAEKDIFYIVGHVSKGKIRHLFIAHGRCYAAKKECYDRVEGSLKKSIDGIIGSLGLEGGETLELGRVHRVDPLGITELRVRGMWQIEHPMKVFEDIYTNKKAKRFGIAAIMTKEKYDSFPKADRTALEKTPRIRKKIVKVRDPNNPAKLMEAVLLSL